VTGRRDTEEGKEGVAKRVKRRERRASADIDRGPLRTLIKSKRDELGFSQEYVADQINVPLSWYSKVERGEMRQPNIERLRAVASILRLDADEVMIAAGWVRTAAAADRLLQQLDSEDAARLREMHNRIDPYFVRLTPAQVNVVLDTAKLWATSREMQSG
jgi:transcriptional regulator with XRE-family HTH domain